MEKKVTMRMKLDKKKPNTFVSLSNNEIIVNLLTDIVGDIVAKRKSHAYSFFARDPDIEFDTSGKAKFIVFNCTICCSVVKQGAQGSDSASTGESSTCPQY